MYLAITGNTILIDIILKFHCLYSPALGFYSKYNPSLISNIS
jgi:hypothetical protein